MNCVEEFLEIADGTVVGPEWSDDRCRDLLRALRMASVAAPDAPDGGECPGDVAVAARIFHEVLSLNTSAQSWPVFAGRRSRSSLFKAAVLHALEEPGVTALLRLSETSALLGANVARWMLGFEQQTSPTMVFIAPPPPRRSTGTAPLLAAS